MNRIRWSAAAIGAALTVLAYPVMVLVIIPFAASVTDGLLVTVVLAIVLATPLRLVLGALIAVLALRGDRGADVAPVVTAVVAVGSAHLLMTAGTVYTFGFQVTGLGVLGDIGAHLHDLAWWVGTAAVGAWLVARRAQAAALA